MSKGKKTISEHILDALIDNKALLLRDITKEVSKHETEEQGQSC